MKLENPGLFKEPEDPEDLTLRALQVEVSKVLKRYSGRENTPQLQRQIKQEVERVTKEFMDNAMRKAVSNIQLSLNVIEGDSIEERIPIEIDRHETPEP